MKNENTQRITGITGTTGTTAILALIARVAVAAVFLYAGFSKVGDPAAFAQAIERYRIGIVTHELAVIAALYLPLLEITCAIALLFFRKLRAGAAALLAACGAVFVVMLAIAIARGLDISCGCFGGADAATGRAALAISLARALALALASAWLLARDIQNPRYGVR